MFAVPYHQRLAAKQVRWWWVPLAAAEMCYSLYPDYYYLFFNKGLYDAPVIWNVALIPNLYIVVWCCYFTHAAFKRVGKVIRHAGTHTGLPFCARLLLATNSRATIVSIGFMYSIYQSWTTGHNVNACRIGLSRGTVPLPWIPRSWRCILGRMR